MTAILAAEGGYQAFDLSAVDLAWLWFALAVAFGALAFAGVLARGVLRADAGTPAMRSVAGSIQEGASAYLRRQLRTVAVIVAPLAVLVFLTATAVTRPDGSTVLSMAQSGAARTAAFLAGCAMSAITGYVGMNLAVRGNVRTAAACIPDPAVGFRGPGRKGDICLRSHWRHCAPSHGCQPRRDQRN